jgi:tetratricopeptide (TPR) repeat protein
MSDYDTCYVGDDGYDACYGYGETYESFGEEIAQGDTSGDVKSSAATIEYNAASSSASSEEKHESIKLTLDGSWPDWQAEFEVLLELNSAAKKKKKNSRVERKDEEGGSLQARLDSLLQLKDLVTRFGESAKEVSRVLIEEIPLQQQHKTHHPIVGAGIAGGAKFFARNIFFKMAVDDHGIYGGDEAAQKACKAEVRSAKSLIECGVEGLRFPLVCVVDFMGFRMMCSSYISGLSGDTLVYGSCDGGQTIRSSSETMNAMILNCCSQLNLGGHNVFPRSDKSGAHILIHGPVDLEGHVVPSTDADGNQVNKYYLLDFARLLPPEAPTKTAAISVRGALANANESKQSPTSQPRGNALYVIRVPADPASAVERYMAPGPELKYLLSELPGAKLARVALMEGRLAYDASSDGLVNERAQAMVSSRVGERIVRGDAFVFVGYGRVFYCLSRVERVQQSTVPTSSDAFSNFGACVSCFRTQSCAHNARKNHIVIEHSTHEMFTETIKNLVGSIAKKYINVKSLQHLVQLLHEHGINLRWLGVCHSALCGRARDEMSVLKVVLLMRVEMMARTMKSLVRTELRMVASSSSSTPCVLSALSSGSGGGGSGESMSQMGKRVTARMLTLLFGADDASCTFWTDRFVFEMGSKFAGFRAYVLSTHSQDFSFEAMLTNSPGGSKLLLGRIGELLGFQLSDAAREDVLNDADFLAHGRRFSASDFDGYDVVVRSIDMDSEISQCCFELAEAGVNAEERERKGQDSDPLLENERSWRIGSQYSALMSQLLHPPHWMVVRSHLLLSALHRSVGRHEEALQCAEAVVRVLEEQSKFRSLAEMDTALASVCCGEAHLSAGRVTAARGFFTSALAMVEKVYSTEHQLVARIHAYLARISSLVGDHEASAAHYQQALITYRLFNGPSGETMLPLLCAGLGLEVCVTAVGVMQGYNLAEAQAADDHKTRSEEHKAARSLSSLVYLCEDMQGLPRAFYSGALRLGVQAAEESVVAQRRAYVDSKVQSVGEVIEAALVRAEGEEKKGTWFATREQHLLLGSQVVLTAGEVSRCFFIGARAPQVVVVTNATNTFVTNAFVACLFSCSELKHSTKDVLLQQGLCARGKDFDAFFVYEILYAPVLVGSYCVQVTPEKGANSQSPLALQQTVSSDFPHGPSTVFSALQEGGDITQRLAGEPYSVNVQLRDKSGNAYVFSLDDPVVVIGMFLYDFKGHMLGSRFSKQEYESQSNMVEEAKSAFKLEPQHDGSVTFTLPMLQKIDRLVFHVVVFVDGRQDLDFYETKSKSVTVTATEAVRHCPNRLNAGMQGKAFLRVCKRCLVSGRCIRCERPIRMGKFVPAPLCAPCTFRVSHSMSNNCSSCNAISHDLKHPPICRVCEMNQLCCRQI